MNILYISYDGLTDPLGQSQILPYLNALASQGFKFHILSFEKKERYASLKDTILQVLHKNIGWSPQIYTSSPPVLSTLKDIRTMIRKAVELHKKENFDIVHCRSYIAALAGDHLKDKHPGMKFIFDMRGFWADERVEGNIWNIKNPFYRLIYNYFKKKEQKFFINADHIISLTESGKKEIISQKKSKKFASIEVIPCCVDLDLFSADTLKKEVTERLRNKLNIGENDFVVSYLGSIGTWYMLDEMLDFFKRLVIKYPQAKFLFITPEPKEVILKKAASKKVATELLVITKADRNEVPAILSLSDLSLFFIKPVYSKKASSPTKMGEIMSLGIPFISNTGVGDMDSITNVTGAGMLVNNFSSEEYDRIIAGITELLAKEQGTFRQAAKRFYSLEKGVEKYREVYEGL